MKRTVLIALAGAVALGAVYLAVRTPAVRAPEVASAPEAPSGPERAAETPAGAGHPPPELPRELPPSVELTPIETLIGPTLYLADDPVALHAARIQRLGIFQDDDGTAGEYLVVQADAVMLAGRTWQVSPEATDLIVWDAATGPAVHEGVHNPHEVPLAEAARRPLMDYERTGLERLRRGGGVMWSFEAHGLHALGPIRASSHCLSCHENHREGALMGVFSYRFQALDGG